ncbi:hypothetical protein Sjap_025821 [Stephania japonica]|uniref:Myb/SANT-like domain-containing protein n=1 Tax=Stephania japonica TaxID=461633 RepID=A0AAP0HJW7_9MAGN
MEESIGSVKVVTKGQLRWDDKMDKILLEIILEEYGLGNGSNTSWKAEVYTRVCVELLKQLKLEVNPSNVKGRIKTFRTNYFLAKDVISQSGFGWDPDTQLATANVLTWKDYLEKHPEKESYRRKRVPYYNELSIIFGDDQANGRNAMTGNEADRELPSLEEMSNVEKSLPTKEEREEVNRSSSSSSRMATNGERIKRKKSSDVDPNQGLTAAANRLADAFAHTDCARLQKELRSIPELSREDIMRAMLLLGSEVKDANIFFQLDEDLKKDWVILYLQRKF